MTKTANLTQIGIGSVANDGTGDTLREAFIKVNDNFSALYQGGQLTANVADSKSLPGIVWQGDKNSGFYHPGNGQIGVALNGQEALLMTPSKLTWKGDEIAGHAYVDAKIDNIGAASGLMSLPVVDALPVDGLFDGRLVLFNDDNQTYLCLNNTWIPYKNNIIANGQSGIEVVNVFPTDNLWEGRTILRTSDTSIYVRRGDGWTRVLKYNTPAANGISAIDVVASLPSTGNFNGREAIFNDQVYIHNGTAWVSLGNYVSTSTTAMQVVSVAPTTGLVEGKVILLANTLNKSNANAYVYIDNKFENLGNLLYTRPSPPAITDDSIYTAALQDLSVTGQKLALLAVGNVNMAVNSVITSKIQDGSVTGAKFADGSITALKLADGAVTSVKIASGAVTETTIADSSVTTAKIVAGNVTTPKIADLAVTNGKLADGAVGTIKIADLAVTTGKLADSAISTIKVADKAITAAKLSDDAKTALTPVADQTALKLITTIENNLTVASALPSGSFVNRVNSYLYFNENKGNWVRSTYIPGTYDFDTGASTPDTSYGNASFKLTNYSTATLRVNIIATGAWYTDDLCNFRILRDDVSLFDFGFAARGFLTPFSKTLTIDILGGQTTTFSAEGWISTADRQYGRDFVLLGKFYSEFNSWV
jgi:hypothetical protein